MQKALTATIAVLLLGIIGCENPYLQRQAAIGRLYDQLDRGGPSTLYMKQSTEKYDKFKDWLERGCVLDDNAEVTECGFLYDVWITTGNRTEFAKAHCDEHDDNACKKKYWEAYSAKASLRYRRADSNWVDLKCKAAGGCNPKQEEIYFLGSHNKKSLNVWWDEKQQEIDRYDRYKNKMEGDLDSFQRTSQPVICSPLGGSVICN